MAQEFQHYTEDDDETQSITDMNRQKLDDDAGYKKWDETWGGYACGTSETMRLSCTVTVDIASSVSRDDE